MKPEIVVKQVEGQPPSWNIDFPNGRYVHGMLSVFIYKEALRHMLDQIGGDEVCVIGIETVTERDGELQKSLLKVGRCSETEDGAEFTSGRPGSRLFATEVPTCEVTFAEFHVDEKDENANSPANTR